MLPLEKVFGFPGAESRTTAGLASDPSNRYVIRLALSTTKTRPPLVGTTWLTERNVREARPIEAPRSWIGIDEGLWAPRAGKAETSGATARAAWRIVEERMPGVVRAAAPYDVAGGPVSYGMAGEDTCIIGSIL